MAELAGLAPDAPDRKHFADAAHAAFSVLSASAMHTSTEQFRSNCQSRVTHPPVDHELWSRSRVLRPLSNHQEATQAPNCLKKKKNGKKDKNFSSNAEIFGGCRNVK
jgi:hypothetical protein